MRLAATGTGEATGKRTVDRVGWLGLAASPTFLCMASMAALAAPDPCSATDAGASVNDMALMYLLMGLFHLPPWLRLPAFGSRRRAGQTQGD